MKKKILRLLTITILIVMIFVLTGCTNEVNQNTSNIEQEANSEDTVPIIKKWETLTMENMQEKVGEHIKWFYAAYLGEIYGWNNIYEYKDVIGQVEIPGVDINYVSSLDELVGVTSKKDIEDSLANYVSRDKFSKFSESKFVAKYEGDFLGGLTEYNGKVYWISDGVGGGFYMKNPRIVSSHNEITKIKIDSYAALGEVLEEIITLTFEYDMEAQKFLIIDWEVESQY